MKDFSAINYPFTFLSEREADHLLDGEWGRELLQALPAQRLVRLAHWENGFRHLTNSKRAVENMAQVKGICMRTMQNQMLIDSFTELGFEAVPMAFSKVYPALADGQVDGQENPLPTILSSRFYEVQQHLFGLRAAGLQDHLGQPFRERSRARRHGKRRKRVTTSAPSTARPPPPRSNSSSAWA